MASKTIIVTKHHLEMWRSKNNRCSGRCQSCGKQFQVGDKAIQTKGNRSRQLNILHCPEHYYSTPVKEASA